MWSHWLYAPLSVRSHAHSLGDFICAIIAAFPLSDERRPGAEGTAGPRTKLMCLQANSARGKTMAALPKHMTLPPPPLLTTPPHHCSPGPPHLISHHPSPTALPPFHPRLPNPARTSPSVLCCPPPTPFPSSHSNFRKQRSPVCENALPGRLELPSWGLTASRSDQLSYGSEAAGAMAEQFLSQRKDTYPPPAQRTPVRKGMDARPNKGHGWQRGAGEARAVTKRRR